MVIKQFKKDFFKILSDPNVKRAFAMDESRFGVITWFRR
jgi:hypothetical protein